MRTALMLISLVFLSSGAVAISGCSEDQSETTINGAITCGQDRISGAEVYIKDLVGVDYTTSSQSDGSYAFKINNLQKGVNYTFTIGVRVPVKSEPETVVETKGSIKGGETEYIGFMACPED